MKSPARPIGPLGTAVRVLLGAAMVYAAFAIDGLTWREGLLGIVVFPATLLLGQWLRARRTLTPLRATGPIGHALNIAILIGLLLTPVLRDATLLFYGGSMLLAALRGYAGCEVLAVSNWALRRDDQVGCVVFSPLDALEARRTERAV